ncbi:MAG: metallophosphoesterase [Deltaproteobacteria bacterium]|nr:metallophosphoesterase [Deltaproteobacteria bacterium]
MPGDRPLLIFVSDIHLTDVLHGNATSKADQLTRFWERISAVRGKRPAELCIVGDLFDLVRSPSWFDGRHRPYHGRHTNGVVKNVEAIVDATIRREQGFFDALKAKIATGELTLHYVAGNHDRLLRTAPAAQQRIADALGLKRLELHTELEFPEHGVLAYHGHVGDPINASPDGDSTIGDAIGSELILKFPRKLRAMVGADHPGVDEIDDIDDVRPVYAVPAWVRQQSAIKPELLRPIREVWSDVVDEFLANDFVRDWLRTQHKLFSLDLGKKLRLLLELSRNKLIAHGSDERLTQLYRFFQQSFDGKMSAVAASELQKRRGLRYVVNGHSHFASMQPLGRIDGKPAVYFNTGTWRAVHQIGHDLGGRPSFLPYDAMTYLVFFPDGDKLGRDYEWWTGASVARA